MNDSDVFMVKFGAIVGAVIGGMAVIAGASWWVLPAAVVFFAALTFGTP